MIAARTNKGGDELLEITDFNGNAVAGDPSETPQVKDLEIVFIAWDVLFWRNQARKLAPCRYVLLGLRLLQ